MSASDGDLTGLVLAAIFGSLFLITCILSAIKAVRDRRRMKVRIAERERLKREKRTVNPEADVTDMEVGPSQSRVSVSRPAGEGTYDTDTSAGTRQYTSLRPVSTGRLEVNNPYPYINGIDNLTYTQSHADFQFADADVNEPQTKTKPPRNAVVPHEPTKRTLSNDTVERRRLVNGPNLFCNLSPECLAVQKNIRRNSYELAIYEHSWTSPGMRFASSETIVNTYNYGNGPSGTKTVCFSNRAFDKSAASMDTTGCDRDTHAAT